MPNRSVVLLVEDESFIRLSTADELQQAGFVVLEADSASEAIQILEQRHDICIVFTDVHLEDSMDGLELLRFVASRWPPIRLFATSGAAAVTDSELPSGAKFFPKPYDRASLVSAFQNALR